MYKDKKILVVDDNEHVGWAIKFLLQEDYNVELVITGDEAMAYLDKVKSVDLILMDYHLKGDETGRGALHKIRSKYPDIKAILVTANSDGKTEDYYKSLGFSHVIEKPFKIKDLQNIVKMEVENEARTIGD